MLTAFDSLRLSAVCACLPSQTVANDAMVAQTTGIFSRRIALSGTTVVDLCVRAAERAFLETDAKPADFGAVVFVSFTQHFRMPSGAAQAQARLGMPKDVIAFDVSLACSGWGYGLYLSGLLARQTGKKVLLLDGDVQSAFLNQEDVNTVALFSDGGTATIVECQEGAPTWCFSFVTDGAKGDVLKLEKDGTINMDGFGVFRFVATDVVGFLRDFISEGSLRFPLPVPGTLAFVPHQPNVYLVRQLAKSLGFDEARTAVSCDRFGNLSSASVPVTIAANHVRGPALVAGFGGGLSASAARIDIPADCVLALLETG